MIAPCPACGSPVDTRGLAAHRGSRPCTVHATVREALARGLVTAWPHQKVLGRLGAVEWVPSRYVPGGPTKRAKIQTQPWAPAALVALAAELRQGGADMGTRWTLLRAAIRRRALLPADEQFRQDRLAQAAEAMPEAGWQRAAGVVYLAERTVTPEQTLREAGIDDARQAEFQRKMSALLAGRP
ncbi:MAG: hypothetical protein HYY19_04335 [Candidatus Rokubacteria bacterium]|nr:hypothetical protein [Candidatus Rokubacteria bacterium]